MTSQPPPPPPSRIETALEISPLTVLTPGVLEWACPHAFFEELFDPHCRPNPWNRKLPISATPSRAARPPPFLGAPLPPPLPPQAMDPQADHLRHRLADARRRRRRPAQRLRRLRRRPRLRLAHHPRPGRRPLCQVRPDRPRLHHRGR